MKNASKMGMALSTLLAAALVFLALEIRKGVDKASKKIDEIQANAKDTGGNAADGAADALEEKFKNGVKDSVKRSLNPDPTKHLDPLGVFEKTEKDKAKAVLIPKPLGF